MWSDIPNDRILRYDEATDRVGVFRHPAGYTNGHTVDGQGRLVSCEHGARRVTRTEHDGTITVLADSLRRQAAQQPQRRRRALGRRRLLHRPVVRHRGLLRGLRGRAASSTTATSSASTRSTGTVSIVADDFDRPNGLAFSLDERLLYVSDTGASPKHMRVLDVADDGTLSNRRQFADCTVGGFDGFRLDEAGRIWTSAGDGVHVYDPDGTLLGKVLVPEIVANVAWGGAKRNRLYICATTSLYAILLPVRRRVSGRPPRPLPDAPAGRRGGSADVVRKMLRVLPRDDGKLRAAVLAARRAAVQLPPLGRELARHAAAARAGRRDRSPAPCSTARSRRWTSTSRSARRRRARTTTG